MPKRIFLTTTGAGTWTVPADWNNANNSIECIGGGSGGARPLNGTSAAGGAGGAYAKLSNVTLTRGATVNLSVGTGGAGGAAANGTTGGAGASTWLRIDGGSGAPANTTQGVLAAAAGSQAGGALTGVAPGGAAASSVGTVTTSGGSSGAQGDNGWGGSGGGAAAGPNGAGGAGGAANASDVSVGSGAGGGGTGNHAGVDQTTASSTTGTSGGAGQDGTAGGTGISGASGNAGSHGSGGAGGGGSGTTAGDGGAGGAGVDWDSTHGAGGGGAGGGGGSSTTTAGAGGAGGLYGGGGGGGGAKSSGNTGNGGNGGQGIIAITYEPVLAIAVGPSAGFGATGSQASVTLAGCVAGNTVGMICLTDDNTTPFQRPTCTGEVVTLCGEPFLTHWGGTEMQAQFATCTLAGSGSKTFTTAGPTGGDGNYIIAWSFDTPAIFDTVAIPYWDRTQTSLASPQVNITTGAPHAAIFSFAVGGFDDTAAFPSTWTHLSVADVFTIMDGAYLLDSGSSAGQISIPWRLAGTTPFRFGVCAASWLPVSGAAVRSITAQTLSSDAYAPSGNNIETGFISPAPNKFLVATLNAHFTALPSATAFSVSGNGLTWVRIAEIPYNTGGSARSLVVFGALTGTSPLGSDGPVFAKSDPAGYSGTTHTVTVVQYDGVDLAIPIPGWGGTLSVGTGQNSTSGSLSLSAITIPGTPYGKDLTCTIFGSQDNANDFVISPSSWSAALACGPGTETQTIQYNNIAQNQGPSWTWATTTVCAAAVGFILKAAAFDNFERLDGAIGGNWTTVAGTPSVFYAGAPDLGVAYGAVSGNNAASWNDNFANDQYAQVTVDTIGGQDVGCYVRGQAGAFSCYLLDANPSNIAIWKVTAGSLSLLTSASISTPAAGDILRLEVSGTSLAAKINGTTKCSTTDSTYSSGAAGIWFNNTGGAAKDFYAGPLVAPPTGSAVGAGAGIGTGAGVSAATAASVGAGAGTGTGAGTGRGVASGATIAAWYDPEFVPNAWFDAEINQSGWFDRETTATVQTGVAFGQGSGTGTGAGVSASLFSAAGAGAGNGTGAGVGNANFAAAGAGAGNGTGAAVGVGATGSVGAGSGTGTGAGVGNAAFLAAGAGAGNGTGAATGAANAAGAGAGSGNGTGTAVGAATAAATGAGSGTGTGTGFAGSIGAGAGNGTGAATSAILFSGAGAGAGNGTGAGVGNANFAATGAGAGNGTGSGFFTAPTIGTGAGAGTGTGAATGVALFTATGAGSGNGTGAATANANFAAAGAGAGSGTGAGVSASLANSAGAGSGTTTGAGAGNAVIAAVGAGSGAGTGAAFFAAAGTGIGAGAGNGTGAATSAAIAAAAGAGNGKGTGAAAGNMAIGAAGAGSGKGTGAAIGVNAGVGTGAGTSTSTGAAVASIIAAALGAGAGIGTGAGAGHQIGIGTQRKPTTGVGAIGRDGFGDKRPATEFEKRPGSQSARRPVPA